MHAVAGEDERPFGRRNQIERFGRRAVTRQRIVERFGELRFGGRPVDFAGGLLRVEVGLYRLDTGARLPAGTGVDSVDVSSARASGTR